MKKVLLDPQKWKGLFNELLNTGDVTVYGNESKSFEKEATRRGLKVKIVDAGIVDDGRLAFCYVLTK